LDAERIHREWLYFAPDESESLLYERRFEEGSYIYDIPENSLIETDFTKDSTLPANTLLLAVLAKFTDSPARRVMEWMGNAFNVISSPDEKIWQIVTQNKLDEEGYHTDILKFLKVADLGIEDVFLESVTAADLPDSMPKELRKKLESLFSRGAAKQVVFQHNIFDDKGTPIDKKTLGTR